MKLIEQHPRADEGVGAAYGAGVGDGFELGAEVGVATGADVGDGVVGGYVTSHLPLQDPSHLSLLSWHQTLFGWEHSVNGGQEQHPTPSAVGGCVGDGVGWLVVDGGGGVVGGLGADEVIVTSAQLKNCSGQVVPRVPSFGYGGVQSPKPGVQYDSGRTSFFELAPLK